MRGRGCGVGLGRTTTEVQSLDERSGVRVASDQDAEPVVGRGLVPALPDARCERPWHPRPPHTRSWHP